MKKAFFILSLLGFAFHGGLFAQTYITELVKDIKPGTGNGMFVTSGYNFNGTFFFPADDGNGLELWKTNGTTMGTSMLKDINPTSTWGGGLGGFATVNGSLLFAHNDSTHGVELWKTNGTEAGTVMVKDIFPGTGHAMPQLFLNMDGTVFFTANDGAHGIELWKTDGTDTGTVMVKNINPGNASSMPSDLVKMGGTLFFTADDGTNGKELWKSDGTASGTVLVRDIWSGGSSNPSGLTDVNGVLFFGAKDDTHGRELWCSDGTYAGTTLVKDIWPGVHDSYGGGFFPISFDNEYYFAANDSVHGMELWKSDGTSAGTVLLKDIFPAGGDGIQSGLVPIKEVGGALFFPANDGVHGRELWCTDGTAAGTLLVKDIWPGISSGLDYFISPNTFTNVGGKLFFPANNGIHGTELWKSSGTAAGTNMVQDVWPGSNSSDPLGIWDVDGHAFFTARDAAHGRELWMSTTCPFFFADFDGDGYGNPYVYIRPCLASPPSGYAANSLDCDDGDPNYPKHYYPDADADFFGATGGTSILACVAPAGYVADNTDCDDANALYNPLAADICGNSFDENCNGVLSDPIVVGMNIQNAACANSPSGSISLSLSCGIPPFAYTWSSGATTQNLNNVPPGTYTVTVEDAQGLIQIKSGAVSVSPLFSLTITTVKPTCHGGSNGSLVAKPASPTTGYTYHWNTGANTQTLSNLAAGTYTVTVTKTGTGCTRVATAALTEPKAITVAFLNTAPACAGGATGTSKATASGGTGTKTYAWSTGATTPTITGLMAGTYTVTATDAKNCTSVAGTTIAAPPILQITGLASAPSGSSYKVTVTATGGTGTKKYRRSNGVDTFTAWQSGSIFLGVAAGTYTWQVRDAKSCTASIVQSVPVVLGKPVAGSEGQNIRGFEETAHGSLTVYPNPVHGILNVGCSGEAAISCEAVLFNPIGQRVLSQDLHIEPGEAAQINVQHLALGPYYLVFRGKNGEISSRRFDVLD